YYVDWERHFYPAAQHWQRPYTVDGFYNVPWLGWILRPFAAFDAHYSYTCWILFTVSLTMWSMRRLGAPLPTALLCLLTPYFHQIFINGNVDVLVLAGYSVLDALPALGTVLILVKPQELSLCLLGVRYTKLDVLLLGSVMLVSAVVHGNWIADLATKILS